VAAAATAVFVNRTSELEALHAAFAEASSGRAQTLIVEGEAGFGKTALIERFLSGLPEARLLRAGGDESETHVPFAVADQLRRAARPGGAAPASPQHVRVGLELLELIGAEADAGPCIVLVDDAHLSDVESLRAILFAARRLAASRVLLLVVVRGDAGEALPEGWRKLARGVVTVGPLAPGHLSELGSALGVPMSPDAAGRLWEHTGGSPLHARAVLRELPDDAAWPHEQRPLPVPSSYAQLVRRRLERCPADVVALVEAAAVLGGRAPLRPVVALARVPAPLDALDDAIASGLVRLQDRGRGPYLEFSHPLARAAIYDGLPHARRRALNLAAAGIADDAGAALRHRVEAATAGDDALLRDLEAHAHAEMARGAWSSAVSSLVAGSRLAERAADRERLVLEAIEALLYAGDGAAARRLAERARFADGPRRDSVLAYLAMFAGDLAAAQRRLSRAWDRRDRGGDDRLSATIAQRSALLATSRLRGREALEWVRRATGLAPDDPAVGLLVAPSLALGMSFTGRPRDAHAALDRWLDDAAAPRRATGFVLLALKGFLLLADGDLGAARAAFEASAAESLERGLLVVAALSLSGLTRAQFLAGDWDGAVVSGERSIALGVESEDRWIIGQAHWSASWVPAARGDWAAAEGHVRAIHDQAPRFERHVAAAAIAAAGLATARERPAEALRALAALERMAEADGVDDPAFLPWHHLKAQALVDAGELDRAERCLASAAALAAERGNPLLGARLARVRGRLALARGDLAGAAGALGEAHARVAPLAMPYEQALVELAQGQVLRRRGERRAAAAALMAAHGRLAAVQARPALERCEKELAGCGLAPARRPSRDYAALTAQELAVTRLVVAGLTNREVAEELMVSTKTVEFHLGNAYMKLGVRSRSELRARARANELPL
jgi:DNA-binding CsgD family transcriptional regulator